MFDRPCAASCTRPAGSHLPADVVHAASRAGVSRDEGSRRAIACQPYTMQRLLRRREEGYPPGLWKAIPVVDPRRRLGDTAAKIRRRVANVAGVATFSGRHTHKHPPVARLPVSNAASTPPQSLDRSRSADRILGRKITHPNVGSDPINLDVAKPITTTTPRCTSSTGNSCLGAAMATARWVATTIGPADVLQMLQAQLLSMPEAWTLDQPADKSGRPHGVCETAARRLVPWVG